MLMVVEIIIAPPPPPPPPPLTGLSSSNQRKKSHKLSITPIALARYVVFVAPSEWENGCVRIKDLRAEEYAEEDADKQVDAEIQDLWKALDIMRENENQVRARRGFASL